MKNNKNQETKRTIIGVRENEKFYNRLYDRLDAVTGRYINGDFTLFLTVLPRIEREEIKRYEHSLKYQGVNAQRYLLEARASESFADLDAHWRLLAENTYSMEQMRVSNELYYNYKNIVSDDLGDYVFCGELDVYFRDPSGFTQYQIHEFPILNRYFNIKEDHFISLPLIQFGEIDGIVHVIYTKTGHGSLFNPDSGELLLNVIQDLIVGFSNEYEEIISDWHLSFGSLDFTEEYQLAIDRVGKACLDDEKKIPNPDYVRFWETEANNILRILEYQAYYTIHYSYFISKIEQHQRFLTDYYTRVLRQGVITVLLDSYAHNVSAHALTTLSWIYSKRSSLFARRQTFRMISLLGAASNNFRDIEPYKGAYEELINLKEPIPLELYPLFKFLQEKGGFWSGLTRDLNPGGLTSDLFSVLWDDFVCNVLYLGTIVESEDIRKLHVRVTIYADENPDEGFIVSPEIIFAGDLATINLESKIDHHYDMEEDDCYLEVEKNGIKERLWYRDHPELEPLSRFVQPGANFEEFKHHLRSLRAFLPGGVVGKHALYNIFENELRNIKHFTGEELSRAKNEGLTLNISVQGASLDEHKQGEMYRIGVWLGLEAPLQIITDTHRKRKKTSFLIKRRFESLWEDIIDSENNFQPRLSGNNQDKVCAAMLFNSRFSSVQDGSRVWVGLPIEQSTRDRAFYPWITPAVASADGKKEFQIKPPGRHFDVRRNKGYYGVLKKGVAEYTANFMNGTTHGILKKYFYIWKGHDVLPDTTYGSDWDNTTRFRIVYSPGSDAGRAGLRRKGILRILPFAANDAIRNLGLQQNPVARHKMLFEAYKQWLGSWLKEEKMAICLYPEKEPVPSGLVLFDKGSEDILQYYTTKKLSEKAFFSIAKNIEPDELYKIRSEQVNCLDLEYAHASGANSPGSMLYRKHGVMNRYFTPLNESTDLNIKDMSADRFAEWVEMMVARICVIDNRILHRMRLTGRDPNHYRDHVRVLFCSEDKPEPNENQMWTAFWDDESTKIFIRNCHFLILHLSFIENILQNKYNNFKGDIGLFIENELLPIWGDALPHNFILAVTSGRGRNTWWEDLPKNPGYEKYIPHIIFRPIESLLSAVEGGATQKDDFELKYRFTKVLFGS